MIRLASLLLLVFFQSCTDKYQAFASHYNFTDKTSVPDYRNPDYWAAHPWKKDPSDSISRALQYEMRDSVADVFFIHPTTYTGVRTRWNANINDPYLNAKTDYSTILYQASVFNQHCRVFAPRYRQAHLSAFFIEKKESDPYFDTAYADVKQAFEFYLEHYHDGRPIIIAGHSQGAKLAERLLKEFFDGKALQKRLVAAYIIGWPIPQDAFEYIPVCRDSLQTGCFCGWRTFKTGYKPAYIKNETTESYVTNPLSWKTDSGYVSAKENKGSILRDFNTLILHTADAAVQGGVVWSHKPKFPGSLFYRSKNYHIADINLFYMNMRSNIETRIRQFLKN